MASIILVHSSASVMDVGLTRRYLSQSVSRISTCNPSQCSWPRAKSGGGRFMIASSSNDLTFGRATVFPSWNNSPNSSAPSLCSVDNLSSLPDAGLTVYYYYVPCFILFFSLFFWCPCMAINVSVQYNDGLLPDIILLTQCYFHMGTRLNAMKRFCIHLQPMIPPKRFGSFLLTGGCLEGLGAF